MANPGLGINAGLARRFAAHLLDLGVGLAILMMITAGSCAFGTAGGALGGAAERAGAGMSLGCGGCLGSFALGLSGYTIFALYFLAQGLTPGKWLVGIRVVDKRLGTVPGLGRMLVREIFGKLASGFFLSLGYFWAIWDPDSQTWHDKIAGTLVLRRRAAAAVPPTGVNLAAIDVPSLPVVAAQAPLPRLAPSDRPSQSCSACGEAAVASARFCEDCGAVLESR